MENEETANWRIERGKRETDKLEQGKLELGNGKTENREN